MASGRYFYFVPARLKFHPLGKLSLRVDNANLGIRGVSFNPETALLYFRERRLWRRGSTTVSTIAGSGRAAGSAARSNKTPSGERM